MLRRKFGTAALILGCGLIGCDSGGIQEGSPKEVSGVVLPDGFEKMQKAQGADMGKKVVTKAAPASATAGPQGAPAPK